MTKATQQDSRMKAERGNTVKIHYSGTLEDGTEFVSTANREPLELTIGESEDKVPRRVGQAAVGMSPHETKTLKISSSDAYGPYRKELVFRVERSRVPVKMTPELGKRLTVQFSNGSKKGASIIDVSDSHVIVNANHPLAGKDLTFHIRLVEIASPNP